MGFRTAYRLPKRALTLSSSKRSGLGPCRRSVATLYTTAKPFRILAVAMTIPVVFSPFQALFVVPICRHHFSKVNFLHYI